MVYWCGIAKRLRYGAYCLYGVDEEGARPRTGLGEAEIWGRTDA